MALKLVNLDVRTRQCMLAEVEDDIASGNLYLSLRLTADGQQHWAGLLKAAIQSGDDQSLVASLEGWFNEFEQRCSGQMHVAQPPARLLASHWD